jgi:hypothetical protein
VADVLEEEVGDARWCVNEHLARTTRMPTALAVGIAWRVRVGGGGGWLLGEFSRWH